MSHDARQTLEVMIRSGQGGALVWSTEKVQQALDGYRDAILREAADALPYDAPLRTDLGPYMDVVLHRVADFLRSMASADARIPTCYVQFMGGAHCATPPVADKGETP